MVNSKEPPYSPLHHARLSGERARERGRELSSCPLYGMGEDGRSLRNEWERGWQEIDEKLRPPEVKKIKSVPIRKGRRK